MNLINQIVCGDNLEVLKSVPDNIFDTIFFSPPYEAKIAYDSATDLSQARGDKFVELFTPILFECKRTIKPTGNIFINFQGQITDKEYSLTEQKIPIVAVEEVGLRYISPGYWFKPNARPDNYDRRLKNHIELIWHFVKDKEKYIVYKDAVREVSEWATKDKRWWKYNPKGKDPGNVFIHKKEQTQKTIHPAKMIDELAEFYIKYGSKEGNLICDPYNGSGTTCLAAKKLGRNYFGIDISPEYCRITNERLKNYESRSQLELSLV